MWISDKRRLDNSHCPATVQTVATPMPPRPRKIPPTKGFDAAASLNPT